MSVSARFTTFLKNISLTDEQLTKGRERRESVVEVLRYKTADYEAEKVHISNSNDGSNGNTRDLIRMMKKVASIL